MVNTSISKMIDWRIIDNKFNVTATDDTSPCRAPKMAKKIKRRTTVLNSELKKFASLKSYSEYVRIKTVIVREMTDNEDTEDEPYNSSTCDDESRPGIFTLPFRSLANDNCGRKSMQKEDSVMESDGVERISVKNNKFLMHENRDNKKKASNVRTSAESIINTRGCTGARRNLTLLLDHFEDTDLPSNGSRTLFVNDENDDVDNNNKKSFRETKSNKEIAEMINVQPGDSGIDDDSQDNSSTNRENDNAIRLEDSAPSGNKRNLSSPNVISRNDVIAHDKEIVTAIVTEIAKAQEQWQQQSTMPSPLITEKRLKIKSQPIITSTEIVKSKYTIVRDVNEKEECRERSPERRDVQPIEDFTELNQISPESRRVSQMKRINLLCSDTENDSSHDDDDIITEKINYASQYNSLLPLSQVIDYPSDSDESIDSEQEQEKRQANIDSHLSVSSSFRISDSDDSRIIVSNHDQKEILSSLQNAPIGSEKKSIKSQIEEQEAIDRLLLIKEKEKEADDGIEEKEEIIVTQIMAQCKQGSLRKSDELSIVDATTTTNALLVPSSDAESVQYFPMNICKRNNIEVDDPVLYTPETDTQNRDTLDHDELISDNEILSRPITLRDFIAKQGLVPTCNLSTITINDVLTIEEDDEIWLLEIPKLMVTERELCGKSMALEKQNLRIGDTSYDATIRNDQSVSCILRAGRKKGKYRTVNIRPVGSIVVRQKFADKRSFSSAANRTGGQENIVPFPKTLKSRNPLVSKNKGVGFSKQATSRDDASVRGDKKKSRKHVLWHIDNFILKTKKKKMNFL